MSLINTEIKPFKETAYHNGKCPHCDGPLFKGTVKLSARGRGLHGGTLQTDRNRSRRRREGITRRFRPFDPRAAVRGRLTAWWLAPQAQGSPKGKNSMSSSPHPHRLSAGVVVVSLAQRKLKYLLLRAYRNWDFPKGLTEAGEEAIDAALREVREETTLDDLSFDWGLEFMETGPYNKGKIARYYIARSKEMQVRLPINPDLGRPEHSEAHWFSFDQALAVVSPRLQPVLRWAHAIINHETAPPDRP